MTELTLKEKILLISLIVRRLHDLEAQIPYLQSLHTNTDDSLVEQFKREMICLAELRHKLENGWLIKE